MPAARRPVYEITGCHDTLVVFHRAFEHESPFDSAMDVLRNYRAWLSFEQYGGLFLRVVLVKDLHPNAGERLLPRHASDIDVATPARREVGGRVDSNFFHHCCLNCSNCFDILAIDAVAQSVKIAERYVSELPVSRPHQASDRIQSTTRSPIMMQVKFVLARTMLGITDASTTRSPSTPRTRQY